MPGPVSDTDLRTLSSGRWLIPILAHMSGEDGSRFGVIARRLGLSRSVLSQHLTALENAGWIARQSGHGHPLRPEYLLTPAGRPIADWSERVMHERARLGLEPDTLGRWSLPLVARLRLGRQRFSELQRELNPITPRALSLALDDVQNAALARPDRRLYALTKRGYSLAEALAG